MIIALDVAYSESAAATAAVAFRDWTDDGPAEAWSTITLGAPADYEPGEFYKRELPYLLDALGEVAATPDIVIVDGYVWLDARERAGLGAHLYFALGRSIPVIGVSKSRFRNDDWSVPVIRGQSATPLYVTAVGVSTEVAADHLRDMHGRYRLPTLLKEVDGLARQRLETVSAMPE